MLALPQPVQAVIKTFIKHGFEAYAVGGSVRDMLMRRPTKSWDFTTNATPSQIQTLFSDSFYDNTFGTVGVKIKSQSGETVDVFEITTYRSEKGYSDHRHPNRVVWGQTLEEDLARRDFTINAIATDGTQIIDPFTGKLDITQKIIRTVRNPDERFNEDALRLLRAVRLASELGFVIEPQTFEAIKRHVPLLQNVSSDRIREEFMRIMASDFPADGVMLLKNSGILAVILPELEQTFGVPQQSPKRHHIYDVGTHLIESLRHTPSTNPVIRLATLLHDIGKPRVFRKNPKDGLITFYNHEVVGARIALTIARRLNFSKKDLEKIVTLVRWHQFTVDERQTDATLRRFINKIGKENLKDILDLRIGDRLGGGAVQTSWRLRLFMKRLEEVQKQPFTVIDLKVDGYDVMKIYGISPGPLVGKILGELFNEVAMDKIKNDRDALLQKLVEMKSDLTATFKKTT